MSDAAKLNLTEHVNALFEGVEDVTAEQKSKMETVLETAITSIVAQKETELQESFDQKVETVVESKLDQLDESINKYLDYVITEWLDENRVAIQSGLKVELAESFLGGMKRVFVENNVHVPEGKEDLVSTYEEQITDLETRLNESSAKVIEMGSQLEEHAKLKAIADVSDGLTDTQKERFDSLVEGVEFKDVESFKDKISTIRESYFSGSSNPQEPAPQLVEEVAPLSSQDERAQRLLNPYG